MADHPFGALINSQGYHDRIAQRADLSYEEAKVEYVMGTFKISPAHRAEVRELALQATGVASLTFKAFNAGYPTFPILLGATRLGGVQLHLDATALLPALFRNFGAAPFVTAYDEFYERVEDSASGRVVGLVFPRKGLPRGLMIYAADNPNILPLCEREAYLVYSSGKKKERHWLMVRSFQKVIEALHNGGHGWRPNDS